MQILTPENTKTMKIKVFLNDEDITNKCFYAEVPDTFGIEGEGLVKMFVRNENGVIETDRKGDIKTEEKVGLVRWELAQ